jgi:IS30 family transposase
MANQLKMAEHNAILGLARLGWSFRRIAAEVGVDRDTVARHVKAARGDPPGFKCRHFDLDDDPAVLVF